LPTLQLCLLVIRFAMNLKPSKNLLQEPPAGLFERLSRTFKPLQEAGPDEGDYLLQTSTL
ncbi:hypothetical protein ACC699_38435, partial [Rhizobium ruizarguesonis]